jgi:formate-dependent nitrite reductase membrane component NrfD
MLIHPQWRSWLTRGAFLLIGFSTLAGLWWLLEAGAALSLLPSGLAATVRPYALWIGLPLAISAAVYTAFLFGQAEGRDLWQSSLLPAHLLIQSVMLGGGVLLALDLFIALPAATSQVALIVFAAGLLLDLFVTLLGEFGMPHASEVAARAAHDISHGAYRNHFWWGSIVLGHAAPLALLAIGMPIASALAGALAAVGMYYFEYAFVMAPQDVPNS